jgi:hypothetical protein
LDQAVGIADRYFFQLAIVHIARLLAPPIQDARREFDFYPGLSRSRRLFTAFQNASWA